MTTPMTDRFWRALEDLFTGEEMEGSPSSGFIKLMYFKRAYFKKEVTPALKKTIEKRTGNNTNFREELCERLHDFFSHYFCESGSIYFRHVPAWRKFYDRVYADGEDVALAWKTRDLYYVKSDTLVRSMQVRLPDTTAIYFDASEIEHKKNNERRDFVFEYNGKKDEGFRILAKIKVSYSQNGRTTKMDEITRRARGDDFNLTEDALRAAFKIFRRQTEADFFIHKNARRFLREQFDLWMHDFAFREENEFTAERFEQLQALRNTAHDVIDFIGQFEDELTRLWSKPKFARNVHYVVTANKLNPALRRKIAAHPAMKKQIAEWKEQPINLSTFDKRAFESGSGVHKFLPIDTKYFPAELENEILNSFENLAESLDGELWKSENYQALNTLQKRYAGRIKCVYADPPYNTTDDKIFEYADKFTKGAWLSMLNDRMFLAKEFLSSKGFLYLQLDHHADYLGRFLLQQIFPDVGVDHQVTITWNTGDNISGFKTQKKNWIRQSDKILSFPKNEGAAEFINLWQPKQKHTKERIGWLDFIGPDKDNLFVEFWQNGQLKQKPIKVASKRIGTVWSDIYSFQYSEPRETESFTFPTQKPENLLRRIIQSCTHPQEWVLDFFAGSGTTPAVSQKLGRKWLAIEAGDSAENFYHSNSEPHNGKIRLGILGRMKLVLSGDKEFTLPENDVVRTPHLTKDMNWEGGGFFKYGEFEQYEETLKNAAYKDNDVSLFDANKSVFEQYPFLTDEKFSRAVKRNNEKLEIDFSALYDGIDIAESLANILGKQIKARDADSVTFVDGETRKTNPVKMSEKEKVEFIRDIRPYIWWGE